MWNVSLNNVDELQYAEYLLHCDKLQDEVEKILRSNMLVLADNVDSEPIEITNDFKSKCFSGSLPIVNNQHFTKPLSLVVLYT